MQQFYDDVKKPTETNARIQRAAVSLTFLLKTTGKEVPENVTLAVKDDFTADTEIERALYKELFELVAADPKRASELLDANDSVESLQLKSWWVAYHDARRDYSVEALRLLRLVKDENDNVPVFHEGGVHTHWITKGTSSWPDPESRTHDLKIPTAQFSVRRSEDAGGEYTYLTYPSSANYHNIVRADKGRLVAGSISRPNWMY